MSPTTIITFWPSFLIVLRIHSFYFTPLSFFSVLPLLLMAVLCNPLAAGMESRRLALLRPISYAEGWEMEVQPPQFYGAA